MSEPKKMLQKLGKCVVVAEIGVARGEFSAEILGFTRPDVLHLVDVWNSDRYHEGLFNEVKQKFKESIQSKNVFIHRKLSVEAASDFEDGYFDMIYIDTNHTYETTRDGVTRLFAKDEIRWNYCWSRLHNGQLGKRYALRGGGSCTRVLHKP